MKTLKISPLAGIDNASPRDDALQVQGDGPLFFLREANNVTIDVGRASIRPGLALVSNVEYQDLWQSPLHKDIFARLGATWVKVNSDWSHDFLAEIGDGPASHIVLNNLVLVAGRNGLFQYDGVQAQRFTLDRPPAPMVALASGSAGPGQYGFAVSWLRDKVESPVSAIEHVTVPAGTGFVLSTAASLDPTVTKIRLYMTSRDGGELRRVADYPLGTINVASEPTLGAAAPFRFMEPMRTGQFLRLWRGRLLTASANVLRFSEALAYHIHDPRHGFVQMPQRITFVEPVAGGIWVGQVDHVAFLSGSALDGLELKQKAVSGPVPGSSTTVKSEDAGEASAGGDLCAVWLAGNGYVLGTPTGEVVEVNAKRLTGITGVGASAVARNRLLTVTT